MKNLKERSRENWEQAGLMSPTIEQLSFGALQRIADAAEKMAENYDNLLRDRNWQRDRKEQLERMNRSLERSNAALRGYINRLKKKP